MQQRIRIGTRGSKLALWQANWVKKRIEEIHPGINVELVRIKTTGDKILDVPLAKIGGKGLFVKEIEEALLRGDVDVAVHSMKDVPTEFPEGLGLVAILEREDPRDAFVSSLNNGRPFYENLRALPQGAVIGTSSLRRACQLKHIRPDLQIKHLRGNLDTRLRKLDEGQFDAIVLAVSGMKRLGVQHRITEAIEMDTLLPAIGQGAIGIEARIEDEDVLKIIKPLNHPETWQCLLAERAFLGRLEGGCQVPIAAHARIRDNRITLDALVGSLDGKEIIRDRKSGTSEDAEEIGLSLAEQLLERGAREILREVYGR